MLENTATWKLTMPPSKYWKQFEGRICKLFGGKRRGADYVDKSGGKNDCLCPGWSIECKIMGRPSFGILEEDVTKDESRKDHPNDIPIAIMKRKGKPDKDSLVAMRLETFLEFFVK